MRADLKWSSGFLFLSPFAFAVVVLLMAGQLFAESGDGLQWSGPPLPVKDIVIRVNEASIGDFDWQGAAIALLQLKPGDLLTPQRLAESRNTVATIASVAVDVDPRPAGAVVTVEIRPYKRIKSIHIEGSYPLFERDVRTTMTVASGDVFRAADMPEQEALIAERYRKEGYIDPRVNIEWDQTSDGHYHLEVSIAKGAYYTAGQIKVHGNHAFEETEIVSRLKTWRVGTLGLGFGRFTDGDLDEDIDKLIGFYRKKGFADVSITADIVRNPELGRVSCNLKIDEGPRYAVRFEGNRFFSNFRLKRDLVLFDRGNRGNIGLRRSVQNIRRRYLAEGFAQIQVRWRAATVTGDLFDEKSVTIEVAEGRRHIVNAVIIEGNAHLDADTISKQMLTRPAQGLRSGAYAKDVLHEDLLAIGALYRNRGFLGARITEDVTVDEHTAGVRVLIQVDEGPRTVVGRVWIEGDPPVAVADLVENTRLATGEIYLPHRLEEDEERLSSAISSAGYPYVSVTGTETFTQDRSRVDIRFSVDSGVRVKTGEIFFFGNFRTRDAFLRREMGIDPGDPFDLRQVLEAQRRLRDLNIFDSVQVHAVGLKERTDTVHLFVRCSEKRPYYAEIGGGFQTDKGFFGRGKLGDHNFLGTGKDVSLSAEASEVGSRYELGIFEPRLLGTRFSASAGVYWERSQPFNQDFGVDATGAGLSFSRDWGPFIKTVLANQFERREQFLSDDTPAADYQDSEDFEPRTVFVITPSIQWDDRNSFIRPQRGLLASLAVDFSVGLDNSLDDFIKYRFDARGFYPLLPRTVLAGRVYAGFIEPYGGEEPPQDQLFFQGGAGTVRGYKENLLRYDAEGKAVGGRLALSASLETRIDIGYNFEVIPFIDTGSVQKALVDEGEDDYRWAYGLGLQYITPIGPMGIFYGQKINHRPGESRGRWHISIGYTF